jgi:hypothetical protein
MHDDDFNTSRRRLLRAAIVGTGVGLLAGCDALSNNARFVDILGLAEPLSQRVQRALSGNHLAVEYPESMISPLFRPNGSIDPQTPEYLALKADGFRSYRLRVAGLVERPLEFSLDALRRTNQLVELDMHRLGVTVLGVLDQEHHQEGDDRGAGIDHQLPGVADSEQRPGDHPHQHHQYGEHETQRAAGEARSGLRHSREPLYFVLFRIP